MGETFSTYEERKFKKFMLYGHPRAGKTRMIGTVIPTLKEGELMLYLDFQGGPDAMFSFLDKKMVSDHVKFASGSKLKTFNDMSVALEKARRLSMKGQVKWIVLDTLTWMEKILMTEIKRVKIQGKSGTTVILPNAIPSKDEWGTVVERILELIGLIADDSVNANVIFTAHTDSRYKDSKRPMIGTKSLPEVVMSLCDCIFYLEALSTEGEDGKKQAKYVCYTKPVGDGEGFIAGERSDKLEAIIEPDFALVMEKMGMV